MFDEAIDCEGVSKHKIIKEKDSLYVFILAYNESLFFE